MNPIAALGEPLVLLTRTARATMRSGVSYREWLRQMFELFNGSVGLVTSGMAFFGIVMVTIANTQARRFTGNITVLGPAYFQLLVREFGPLICSLLAATRLGAASAAQLSLMTVTEQVEALEMSAADPLAELVAPRILAGALAVPLLYIAGTVAGGFSAAFTASWAFGVDGRSFIDPRFLSSADLFSGLLKSFACGVYIPLAAARRGLVARGGTHAVGDATTRGVVYACFGCLIIDFVIGEGFLFLNV